MFTMTRLMLAVLAPVLAFRACFFYVSIQSKVIAVGDVIICPTNMSVKIKTQ